MTPADQFPGLLDVAFAEVQANTRDLVQKHALATYPSWGYDEARAFLTFTNGVDQFVVLAQLVGSWTTADGRWQWAWDDATRTERVTRAAREAKRWGTLNGIELLTAPITPVDETLAWKLAAFAARLTGCPAVYRALSGSRFLYFAFVVPPA